jgi:hydrogenase maturation protease
MSRSTIRPPVLVLGIGDILLRDKGIGVRIIEALREFVLPDTIELVDGGTAGAGLLDVVSDRRKIVVIDAMDVDLEPGTILRLGLEDLAAPTSPVSLHEVGLVETFAMARRLGSAPQEVVVFGIAPKEIRPCDRLSDVLAARVPTIVRQVLAELLTSGHSASPEAPRDTR